MRTKTTKPSMGSKQHQKPYVMLNTRIKNTCRYGQQSNRIWRRISCRGQQHKGPLKLEIQDVVEINSTNNSFGSNFL